MKKSFARFLGLALLAAPAFQIHAAIYYVAKDGIDTNPGTDQQPWLTIQKAASAMVAGDKVYVGTGVYPERVVTVRDGEAGKPIVFQGTRGVQMNGFVVKHSYIRIQNFEIAGNCTSAYGGAIFVNPAPVKNVEILDNYFHDIGTNIYSIYLKEGKGYMAEVASAMVTIRGNYFLRNHGHTMTLFGLNHLVDGNTIEDTSGYDAIRLFGRGSIVRSNVFRNVSKPAGSSFHTDLVQTFGDGGPYEARQMIFEKNLAIDCASQVCNIEQQGDDLISDWVFRNNVFLDLKYAANIYAPGIKFYNNTFFRCTTNTGHVLMYNSATKGAGFRGEVQNNIFYECGSNPANAGYGWYLVSTNLVDFVADRNFVCGRDFAPKKTGATRSAFVFLEEHGINGGDPGFVAIESRDVRLRNDSRLVDRGVSLLGLLSGGFGDDVKGVSRSQGGGWDIGAYEFAVPPASVTGVSVE